MLPTAYLVHQISGRMRLRVPDKRGDTGYFKSVTKALSGLAGVEQVIVTPATASILIHHKGDTEPIVAAASERGLFAIDVVPKRSPSQSSTEVNTNRILPSSLDTAAKGLAGLALLQAARGQPFGSAVENFWNGYGAMRLLERPGLAAIFAAIGVYQAFRGRYLGSAASLYFYSLLTRQLAAAEESRAGLRRQEGFAAQASADSAPGPASPANLPLAGRGHVP
jgi:hypothetical protein